MGSGKGGINVEENTTPKGQAKNHKQCTKAEVAQQWTNKRQKGKKERNAGRQAGRQREGKAKGRWWWGWCVCKGVWQVKAVGEVACVRAWEGSSLMAGCKCLP